jgi:hypothetical protein
MPSVATLQPNLGPTALTFDSLVTDLKSYTQRGTGTDDQVQRQIPRIINRSERSIADKLKILGVQYALVAKLKPTNPVIAKPDGWRTTVSINVGIGPSKDQRRTLRARSYEYVRALYPDQTKLDAPRFYADYDQNHWVVGPTPDNDYPYEALVWRLPDLLGPSNQTNYLTQFLPNSLLYECLKHLEPYVRNDARMPLWKQMAADEFSGASGQDMQRAIDRGQTRGPPS